MKNIFLFEFKNWESLDVAGQSQAEVAETCKELQYYLKEIWVNWADIKDKWIQGEDNDDENEVDEDLEADLEVYQSPFLKFNGSQIKSRNYIGVIRSKGVNITLLPKIFWSEKLANRLNKIGNDNLTEEDRGELRNIFSHVFYYFSYCSRVKFPFSQAALENMESDSFLDLLIYAFASYTVNVISEQPYQQYSEVSEETTFQKGRLDINNYINNSLLTGNHQKLYCHYEPFVYDNLLNRIIKHTAGLLLDFTQNENNVRLLNDILFILDEVSCERVTYADCFVAREKLNEFFREYHVVLDMCQMFLANEIVSFETGSMENFCFLLPMEYVFEDFVYGFVENSGIARPSRTRSFLARAVDKEDDNVFQIKPDITLEANKIIIDTKYKVRSEVTKRKTKEKRGVSQADMYQMVAYAIKKSCKKVILLYPSSQCDGQTSSPDDFLVSSEYFNGIRSVDLLDEINTIVNRCHVGASCKLIEGDLVITDRDGHKLDGKIYIDNARSVLITAYDLAIKSSNISGDYAALKEKLDELIRSQLQNII